MARSNQTGETIISLFYCKPKSKFQIHSHHYFKWVRITQITIKIQTEFDHSLFHYYEKFQFEIELGYEKVNTIQLNLEFKIILHKN